ncbi:hypothetical protein GCM10009804_59720 [Kribbella hippodromi]|uniref:N-acetyltransferase domain-containing protein n=1 Tax=Kribbella hippodromi TaxID=434347 RepID=A0ABP4PY67_9ACTN
MAGDDPDLDAAARRALVSSIAAGVTEFASRPGTRVRLIERRSADEWRRCAQRAGAALADTKHLIDTFRRSLPGFERGPDWRSQRAAVDALAHRDADYAVVVEAGDDGPMTVVTLHEAGARFIVVGGGTTFRPAGPLADPSQPTAEQAGFAAQYAVATMAAQDTMAVDHVVSPDGWYGPRALEGRRMIRPDGQARSTSSAALRWSAADARYIAEQVTSRQPDGEHPFPEVDDRPLGQDEHRRLATQLGDWLERGGHVEVYDHEDKNLDDHDDGIQPYHRAELALMALDPAPDRAMDNPIPQRPGVRTMVAMTDGEPQAAVTVGRDAAGDLHVLRFVYTPGVEGATRAAELMMYEAAIRAGGGVSFSRQAALDFAGKEQFAVSASDGAVHADRMRSRLGQVNGAAGSRMSGLIAALDNRPGEPTVHPTANPAAPAVLAATVQRFREAGGDVLFVDRSNPAFVALREQAADRLAAAMGPDGTVPLDVDSLWRVFNPPVAEPGRTDSGRREVAVAVVDGQPVAAVAVTSTGSRYELGALGAVDGADDALVAALVDGVYPRVRDTAPLTMFRADEEANSEQLAALGLEVTGVRPLDDDSRVEVRLPKDTPQAIHDASSAGWTSSRWLDYEAEGLLQFQQRKGTVRRFDHSVAAERQQAEEAIRAVQDKPRREPPATPVPPVNGSRVTLVARFDRDSAYITFDERPGGEIEVVDVANTATDYAALEAVRHGFCDHLAERGQDAVLHERISDFERERGVWGAAESRYFVTGIRNRLGPEAAESLLPAPEPPPAPEPTQTAEAGQTTEAGQETEATADSPGTAAPHGQGKPPRRHGPDGRRGPFER